MRDNDFYFALGFEHGYGGMEQSYPGIPNYAEGHGQGQFFRSRVHRLVPSIGRDDRGNRTVSFLYALPKRAEA